MRYAVKVAYDGRRFHGSQIQLGLRTVEGDFLAAAEKIGIITDRTTFSRASRTDAGVSALGNVFVFESDFRRDAIVPALNSRLRDIWIRGISPVTGDFNPRWAARRKYRYYLPYGRDLSVEKAKSAAGLFCGKHDFSGYTKDNSKNSIIEIKDIMVKEGSLSINFSEKGECKELLRFLQIDLTAQYFLWNMVRWIVGVITAAGFEKIGEEEIRNSLSGALLSPTVKLARPDLLLLTEIEYGDDFHMESFEFRTENIFQESGTGLFKPMFSALLGV